METALLSGFKPDDELVEKTRTIDDHGGIWGIIELWFGQDNNLQQITVDCFDSADALLHQFVVTRPAN